jgi:hypothetical protein
MNWAAQDDMKFDIAADVQRNSLERIKLGIPDGDKCDANMAIDNQRAGKAISFSWD